MIVVVDGSMKQNVEAKKRASKNDLISKHRNFE